MKRIVLKISGELFKSDKKIIDENKIDNLIKNIKKLSAKKYEIVLITGAGNIIRGREIEKINRTDADNMGMLATMINSIALYDLLNKNDLKTSIYSSKLVEGVIDVYDINKVLEDLKNKNIVIVAGGSGLPLCSTDFACVQRAMELNCDTILIGKSVDGVYDINPSNINAKKYDIITSNEIITNHLNSGITRQGVLDITAEALLTQYNGEVILFDVNDELAIDKIISNKKIGTKIVK